MSRFYDIDGIQMPSVTTVLGILDKGEQLLYWSAGLACDYIAENLAGGQSFPELLDNARKNFLCVKDEACSVGSEVHRLIELYAKHNLKVNIQHLRPEVQRGYTAFIDWQKKHKVKFKLTEKVVSSSKYCFAGTLDTVFEYEGSIIVGDWKTSGNFYDTFGLQISSYRYALQEQFGIKTHGEMVIRFDKKDGSFETKDYTDKHDQNLMSFLKLLDFYYSFRSRRLKNNPRAKERGLGLPVELEMSLPGKVA